MRPRCFLMLCLVLFLIPAFAQDKPVIKVVVSRCEWRQPDNCDDGRLSRNQLQWWRETGQKKFPRVQLVEDRNEADWILFWSETESTYKTQATATTIHNPTTNTTSTTVNPSQERVVLFVEAGLHRITRADGALKIPKMPDHFADHTGRWLWSKPD